MSEPIKNRSEFLFLYDVTDSNPNGDPLNENRPRLDEETEINIVTDVRLKRTIRDYLYDYLAKDIFVIEAKREDGTQKSRARRLGEFLADNPEEFPDWKLSLEDLETKKDTQIESEFDKINIAQLEKALFRFYIDLRLFGATIAVKGGTITQTGPVQFKFGRSLHKVEPKFIKGTTVLPSREDVTQGTMTEAYILPYSLIAFYGVANENAAAHTGLSEEDIDLLVEGLWNGTKNLITRSKFGQVPRLLLHIEHGSENYHIGELDKEVEILTDVPEKAIRSTSDYTLKIDKLVKNIEENKDQIKYIEYMADKNLVLEAGGNEVMGDSIQKLLPMGVEVRKLDV
jgi:CRISPR-associated protein Csh2